MTNDKKMQGDHLMKEKHGEMYPYKKEGRISCPLLKAAMVTAAKNGHTDVNMKARELHDDHCM